MELDPHTLDAVRALLTHLCAYPRRSDTAEGIARWWLPAPVDTNALSRALQWLIVQDLIEERHTPGTPVRYRRKASVAALAAVLGSLPQQKPAD